MTKNLEFFNNLFVLDMANNHMGDLQHGLTIISAFSQVVKAFDFPCAIKFQYRDLDTFIHPDFRQKNDFKYVKRFQETRLDDNALFQMKQAVDDAGLISMCTPFDEPSVDKIIKFGFDILKIASCSFTDWPLLERIAQTDLPIVASTAGASLDDIDRVVIFFKHRRKQFALMHCVGEYPTSSGHLDLNQIDFLKDRYPDIPIGYSTHEDPDNIDAVKMAVAKGACIFERHVAVVTEKYPKNAYSSTPEQVRTWMTSAALAVEMGGVRGGVRREIYEKEQQDLDGLKRGVFAKTAIAEGEKITPENTFFAIPKVDGQIAANDMSKYAEYFALKGVEKGGAIHFKDVQFRDIREIVLKTTSKVRNMLVDSRVHIPHMLQFELSHHYGLERLEEWGAIIINCVNREYCKKLIIMLPGQQHPMHYHKKKEETFQVLSGHLFIDLGEGEKLYRPGDIVLVERGIKHSFRSDKGCIFEEISGTHYVDDSYYDDSEILKNVNRKTEMTFWADWLFDEPLIPDNGR